MPDKFPKYQVLRDFSGQGQASKVGDLHGSRVDLYADWSSVSAIATTVFRDGVYCDRHSASCSGFKADTPFSAVHAMAVLSSQPENRIFPGTVAGLSAQTRKKDQTRRNNSFQENGVSRTSES
jgi:hypothetical protein